jgi:hypothetical protein
MNDLPKFQLTWISLASISFTKLLSGQKPWKFAEEDLLGKWSLILACGNNLDRKEFPKSLRTIKKR